MLNKLLLLKITNLLLFISVAIQAFTGMALAFHLFITKPAVFSAIGDIHEHNGFIMAGLVAAHLALNWGWVKANFLKRQ